MKVVIVTWEEYVSDCPADLEVTDPSYLGVFEESDTDGIENAKLVYARGKVAEYADDVVYEPVWDEETGERRIPEDCTLEQFEAVFCQGTQWTDAYGYFNVSGSMELGQPNLIYIPKAPAKEGA